MPFSSDDDEVPDLPQIHELHHISNSRMEEQVKRLERLENEFKALKKEMQTTVSTTCTQTSSNPKSMLYNTLPAESSNINGTLEDNKAIEISEEVDKELRLQEVQYELRTLVPYLSPEFSPSFQDTVLLITAVRNGHGEKGQDSLMDKITLLEAEKRSLSQRLAKKTNECEDLRSQLVGVQQRIQAIKQEEQHKNGILSKRREEMRKQLLIEEGKVQKLNVRYKKLEVENEELRSRVRASLR
ncbi:unnamed protein product [Phytomonas sp. EM1]|nr:unnamed protein product [Phytomonas sp. EM1]|eukprot:CCW59917.1 unnamed protein product [Phytomonas sp. isolate EM1]